MRLAFDMNPLERRLICQNINALQKNRPALFLDRDGVLIEDRHHLSNPEDVALCQGALELLLYAQKSSWPVIVITNQSGIARGYFNWKDYEKVTQKMLSLLGKPCPIAAIYANGYGPDAPANSWRKPNPAMLFAAAKEFEINLHQSLLVGDRLSDLKAGANAGLKTIFHVMSGHGHSERPAIERLRDKSNHFLGENHQPELILIPSLKAFPMHLLTPDPIT